MFMDFWCEIYESVKRKPSRTILTGIGISWGIFILIVLVGIGSGFERGVFKLFNGFSKSTTYVYASETSMGYKGAASGRKIQFQKEDLNMLKSRIPEITHLSPETGRWNAVYAGTKNGWFEVRGVYPDYFLIKLLEVEHGRMLNALDMNEARKVVLIGENVVDMLFRKENPIGKYIRMGQEMFRVIGTIKNTMLNSYEARVIYMPYSVYEQVDATAGRFGTVVFSTVKGAKIKEVNTHVRNVMARKYQFAPSDDKVFYFNSMEEQVKAFTDLFVMIRKFLWFMGISTLVSGVIGVGNIMYSSAKERTREIGIRKSVGAKAQQIKAMFLWESIALTSLAGYVGLVLGWGILKVVALFISEDTPMMEKPGLDFPTAVAAIFILVIAGTLAGLRRAAKGGRKIPASTIRAEYRDIESKLTIPGVIQPSKEIDIKSTITGVLEKLLVQVGDEVVGGQPLAQIRYVKDPLEYRRLLKELEIAETRYLTAEASFERTEKLYVKKLIAQEVYEGEKSNLAVLLSEYESVESELDMLKGQYNQKGISNIITATDAGTILELPIKEGGSVMARGTLNEGTTVARVADLQSLVFKGNVLESDILKLAVGMELSLSVLMDKNITIDGALSLVAPKGIVQDGVARFEITAGLFIPEEYKHVLALEEKYFQFNYDSVFVEIVADKSKYEKRFLKTGISDGIYTEIIEGVDSTSLIKNINVE